MKILLALISALCFSVLVHADQLVRGHYRSNGTYVEPYHRTEPNNTVNDNYSTRGNSNPYTGQEGARPRQEDNNYFRQPSSSKWNHGR